MNSRLYITLYSATLLLSALLLFAIQPMFSKMILPLLGGTPQVWNTAMLFFQLLLLGGYAYAHITSKYLNIRFQAVLHLFLLILFFFVLPIALPEGWTPPLSKDPTLWQIALMTVTIGGPFFVLSGCAPMFQRWFSRIDHKDAGNPYFLYGASNLGSMTALLLYPVIIEPTLDITQQSHAWMYAYMALILFTAFCALVVWKTNKTKLVYDEIQDKDEIITWRRRGKWLILSFIPSSLMLSVTTHVTTDIASVPLLWIIPLALYILTFIIAFAKKPIIGEKTASSNFSFLLIYLFIYSMLYEVSGIIFVIFHMSLFFFVALLCHSALSSSKPGVKMLTEFYLIISVGGALGGIFNALIAPNLFIIPIEYALTLGIAACLRFADQKAKVPKYHYLFGVLAVLAVFWSIQTEEMLIKICLVGVALTGLFFTMNQRWVFGITSAIILLISAPGNLVAHYNNEIVHNDRNFFGVIKIIDFDNYRYFYHGTTIHGVQSLKEESEHIPLAYYYNTSPIANMFEYANTHFAKQKVAVLGLGVGVTACFYNKERSFDFYEIDPDIIKVAENPEYFTFLSGCGSPYEIIEGDARLKLEDKAENIYDFILTDVYSSDNVPVHLITREAVALYLNKLKPDGILGFNISNRYLDLEPVLAQIANSFKIKGYSKYTEGDKSKGLGDAHGFVFAKNEQQEKFLLDNGWTPAQTRKGVGVWTDSFSNIVGVIGTVTLNKRIKNQEEKVTAKAE